MLGQPARGRTAGMAPLQRRMVENYRVPKAPQAPSGRSLDHRSGGARPVGCPAKCEFVDVRQEVKAPAQAPLPPSHGPQYPLLAVPRRKPNPLTLMLLRLRRRLELQNRKARLVGLLPHLQVKAPAQAPLPPSHGPQYPLLAVPRRKPNPLTLMLLRLRRRLELQNRKARLVGLLPHLQVKAPAQAPLPPSHVSPLEAHFAEFCVTFSDVVLLTNSVAVGNAGVGLERENVISVFEDAEALESSVLLPCSAAKGLYPSLEPFRGPSDANAKGFYPSLEHLKSLQGDGGAAASGERLFSISAPFGAIDRRETRTLKEGYTLFLQQLRQNLPKLAETTYQILGWLDDYFPQTESEVQIFTDALNTAESLAGDAARWVFDAIPEADRASLYSAFYQTFRDKLPSSFFEAAQKINPALKKYFSAETPVSGDSEHPSSAETPIPHDSEHASSTETPTSADSEKASQSPEAITAHEPKSLATDEDGRGIQAIQPLPAGRVTPREHIPWTKIKNSISKAHGPVSQIPQWVAAAGTCPLGEGYREIDVAKTTTDVLFRLTLLIVQQIKRKNSKKAKLNDDQALVALCTSAGAFIAAWQQHQQAFAQEDQNAPKAYALLIERLRHVDKYFLKTYDETTGQSNHGAWKKNKAEIAAVGRSALMKTCVKYMKEAGDVATRSFKAGTVTYPSRSLYGGITNTLGARFTDSEVVAQAVHRYAKQYKSPDKVVGLCGALQTSGYFKKCFSEAYHLYAATAFHLHVDGSSVLSRTLARDRPIGKHALAQAACDPAVSGQYFENAFRLLSAAITQEWEREKLFERLSSWTTTSVILAPALEASVPVPAAEPEAAWDPAYEDGIYRIYQQNSNGQQQSAGTVFYVGGLPHHVKPTGVLVQGATVPDSSRATAVHNVESDGDLSTASDSRTQSRAFINANAPDAETPRATDRKSRPGFSAGKNEKQVSEEAAEEKRGSQARQAAEEAEEL
ncbi:rhoptry neck protein RON4 [Besnoitia besnoiti]|uniref:Rhoptry neck protein RON4 n=1 Tax=Besnoitia besnoiti TaxID=94643 RepID=A0A2A9M3U6_BESBE|nr:rhoptry neck protein RON4 [Besnoitia besnoiti]PFH33158.1 rhoptry neck protein RON4 [Besnoitia besnoiti]